MAGLPAFRSFSCYGQLNPESKGLFGTRGSVLNTDLKTNKNPEFQTQEIGCFRLGQYGPTICVQAYASLGGACTPGSDAPHRRNVPGDMGGTGSVCMSGLTQSQPRRNKQLKQKTHGFSCFQRTILRKRPGIQTHLS